jgi:hypothetical protein
MRETIANIGKALDIRQQFDDLRRGFLGSLPPGQRGGFCRLGGSAINGRYPVKDGRFDETPA